MNGARDLQDTQAEAAAERAAIQGENVEPVAFSWGRDKLDAHPQQHTVEDFAAFAKFVCNRRAKVKGKAYFAAPFADDDTGKHHRSKNTAQPRRYLPLDLDHIADGVTMSDLLLALQPYRHFAYTTASSTPEKPRLRIVLELSRAVDRGEGIRCGLAFQHNLIGAAGITPNAVKFDESVYQAEQPCFGLVTASEIFPRDRKMHGAPLDVDELLARAPEIAPSVTAAARADDITHDDPLVRHLTAKGFVLDVATAAGKLAIRCPNAAKHSSETGPTSTVVLLPHFNGAGHAAIKCLHASCANVTQAEFKRLAGFERVNAEKRVRHSDPALGIESDLLPIGEGETALHLMGRDMPQITYLCNPWEPEGLNLVVGRPKLGKSTLVRQKLAAVAEGGELFGERCVAAPCVYLSLEEGDRLTRKKFELAKFSDRALGNITIYYTWKRGKEGVLDLLRLLDQRPEVRYIAIDSLTKARTIPDQRTPAFIADYETVADYHGIAKARPGVCIDLIHHTRKARSDDPLDDISGTYGLSAACDSYWIMRYHEDGAILHVGGRLWERDVSKYQLKRGDQRWELLGEFSGLTQIQRDTLETLRKAGGQGPTDCAKFWNIGKTTAQDRLDSLVGHGAAYRNAGTYYAK